MRALKFWNNWRSRAGLFLTCGLGMAVLAGAGGILGYRIYRSRNGVYHFAEDAEDGGYVMPQVAYQEMLETVEQSYFRIQVNARPELVNGRCNLMIGNPGENKENVQVSLIQDDTGAVIYRSETLEPGQRKAYVTFETALEPGEYPMTAVFHMIDPESGQAAGEIEAGVILTVSR